MSRFFKTADNKIYRSREVHNDYILCTPWENGEDRRKTFDELIEPKEINKHKANFEINEAWRNTTFKWTFNGKKYETRGEPYESIHIHEDGYKQYIGILHLCPWHIWHQSDTWRNKNGETFHREYDEKYKLCMYQGKLIWVGLSQYLPQVFYYKFESIDKEPKEWGGWTNIKCLKPVFCITDKAFI